MRTLRGYNSQTPAQLRRCNPPFQVDRVVWGDDWDSPLGKSLLILSHALGSQQLHARSQGCVHVHVRACMSTRLSSISVPGPGPLFKRPHLLIMRTQYL